MLQGTITIGKEEYKNLLEYKLIALKQAAIEDAEFDYSKMIKTTEEELNNIKQQI